MRIYAKEKSYVEKAQDTRSLLLQGKKRSELEKSIETSEQFFFLVRRTSFVNKSQEKRYWINATNLL